MDVTLEKMERGDFRAAKALCKRAFPPEERPPFWVLRRKAEKGKATFLTIRADGTFGGFVYLIGDERLAYLLLFTVAEPLRGKGCGGAVLEKLKERWAGGRLFLARETLDPSADNYPQRLSRHQFYLHNGFQDLPGTIQEAGVVYDVMGVGGDVSAAEYDALMTAWCGPGMKKRVGFSRTE